jgi:chitinase
LFYCQNLIYFSEAIYVTDHSKSTMKVIGWYPDYSSYSYPVDTIPFQNLTHINYAFLGVNPNGTVVTAGIDLPTLQYLIAIAHGNNTEVWIGIGGADSGDSFEAVADYSILVENIIQFTKTYDLDGIDIDWEAPADTTGANKFVSFMQQLYSTANPMNIGVSASIPADDWGGQWILNEAFPYTDWWNVMAYDFT